MTGEQAAAGARRPPSSNLISVVIPAFNAAAFLGECMDSVQAQQSDVELEICVVDDGSTDGTADLVRARPAIRLVQHGVSRGPSAARNAGIDATHGEFIAFLDADDLWPAGSLAARVRVLRRYPQAALVFGDCRQFDAQTAFVPTLFESGGWGAASWGAGDIVPDAYRQLLQDNFITTGSVVARREALAAAGGFAEELRLVEDLDLWLQLTRGHPIAWCSEVCLLRRRHTSNLSRDPRAMSLAYLEVLRRQSTNNVDATPGLPRQLAMLIAREQLQLADLALLQGRADEALHWAGCSLQVRPSTRAMWRIGRAALQQLAGRPRSGHG